MSSDIICATILETNTVAATSVVERAHTEYVVKVELPARSFVVKKRYREFKKLQRMVAQLAETNDVVLPEFPSPAWLSMRSSVIEERRLKIENYLRVALLTPALMHPILSFFDVPDEEATKVIAALEQPASKPVAQQVNDGEMLIQTFNARLLREPNNKVRVIEDFDQRFFGIQRFIRYEFSVLLLSDAVPLCGDAVFGSKALDIVYKILSREWVRSHQEFRSALLKLPVEMLSIMKLDEYLLGEVRGAANSQAFTIFSVIYDFYHRMGQTSKALRVLNNNSTALDTFFGWSNGLMAGSGLVTTEKKQRKNSDEWVEHSASDCDVSLKHRDKNGFLEVRLAMLVHAPPENVAKAITDWETRRKWDETVVSYKVVETISDFEAVIAVSLEFDRENIPLLLKKTVGNGPNGVIEIEYKQVGKEAGEVLAQPLELKYVLTPTVCNVESRKTSGESSGNSSDESSYNVSTMSLQPGQVHNCVLTYEVKIGADLRKFIVPELTGEQNSLKESCLALKKAMEMGYFSQWGVRSPSSGNLNAAFDSKILRKSNTLALRKVPRHSLPM